jgi:glycosyltransferase involved in cell wall biosynthesis
MRLDAGDVSVLMTVRNGERYISEAIDSVLSQDPPPGELVVVDDGSTDGTPSLLEEYGSRIRVMRQPPTNQGVGLNRAAASAAGSLLAWLDADDVWTPGSLTVRLERLGAKDAPDGVYGRFEQFVSPELGPERAARFRFAQYPAATPLFQVLLLSRSTFERVGPFDETLSTGHNIDWLSRARALGVRFVSIDALVGRRRLHESNLGVTMGSEKNANFLRIVRRHRARNHAAAEPHPNAGETDE